MIKATRMILNGYDEGIFLTQDDVYRLIRKTNLKFNIILEDNVAEHINYLAYQNFYYRVEFEGEVYVSLKVINKFYTGLDLITSEIKTYLDKSYIEINTLSLESY